MEAFESLVAGLLRREGLWIIPQYKIVLTKADKAEIQQPSHPRVPIDILGYRAVTNTVLWIECKSYLDSTGVHKRAFDGSNPDAASKYKVFTNETFRVVATRRLLQQVVDQQLVPVGPGIDYWLVAGKVALESNAWLRQHFGNKGWTLHDSTWVLQHLQQMSSAKYEDDVAVMVAKLLRAQ